MSSGVLARTLVAGVVFLLAAAPAHALRAPDGVKPDVDVRAGKKAPVPAATGKARGRLETTLGPESTLAADRTTGGLRSVGTTDGFLTEPSGDDPATVALRYVRANAAAFGLSDADIDALQLAARYTSPDGVTHVTWKQMVDGVPSYDTSLSVNVTREGRIVNVTGGAVGDLDPPTTTPDLSAGQALAEARVDAGVSSLAPAARGGAGAERKTTFSNGDSASLVVLADPSGDRLAWRVILEGEGGNAYDTVVDAKTGDVLVRHSLTSWADDDATVFKNHPGAAHGGARETVSLTSGHPEWLNDSNGRTRLSGRNAHAYSDLDDGDTSSPINYDIDAGEDVAAVGNAWVFPIAGVAPSGSAICPSVSIPTPSCTWNGVSGPSSSVNREEVTTQVFYFVNTYHDWLASAPIGFTNASHNFEVGGVGGSDPVMAQSDDGASITTPASAVNAHRNNANMTTYPDGRSPVMQMYLFSLPSAGWPAVNGGDDASVVYHEYTHGLSNRLVNNGLGGGLTAQQSRAMGEGWSDYYALDYLAQQNLEPDTAADGEMVMGAYPTNDATVGIRSKAVDCSVGSTAAGCAATADNATVGGYTFADMGKALLDGADHPIFEYHADGEIWAQTLWDLRKAVGAVATRELVTGGLRLSPKDPSFLDARDAIVQEARVIGDDALVRAVWGVFAARGMGFSAVTTSANATRGIPAFDLPTIATATTGTPDDSAGNGNGVVEPGDAIALSIPVTNPGATPLTNVIATLSTTTDGVTVTSPTHAYGTIAASASKTPDAPFVLAIPATVSCAQAVAFSLQVSSDQGSSAVPLTLTTGSGAGTVTKASTLVPVNIPDATGSSVGTASSTVTLDPGVVRRMRVTLSLNHSYTSDLDARLRAPDGTTVQLFERPGVDRGTDGNYDGLNNVTFDDGAATSIQDTLLGDGQFLTGSLRPSEPLSKLDNHARGGTWTLRLTDNVNGDVGTLTAFSITTDSPSCATAPAASTSAASGVGDTTATVGGTVDAAGHATAYRFEYGTTTAYGQATAADSAGAGSGAVARSAALTGLAPGTTYHYRIVALRGSPAGVVAAGADQTFTTTSPPPPPPDGGGGGGGGGAAIPPAAQPPAIPPATIPPIPTVPITLTGAPKTVTVDRKRKLSIAFRVKPAGAKGTVKVVLPKKGKRKAITIGSARFTVSSRGTVKVTLTVSAKNRTALRKLGTQTVEVTVTVGAKRFTFKPKLKLAR